MRTVHQKLIRDRIPEIIENDGGIPKVRILTRSEYERELLFKLIEESIEAINARADKKELAKEIGDLLEIIDAVIEQFNIDEKELFRIKQERKKSRGGFSDRLFLEYVDK